MTPPANVAYAFGDFCLHISERALLRRGQPVSLTPKVFDALVLLVQNAGRLVEKDEFMRRLWPGTFVGEDTLAQNISLLRKVLDDGSGTPTLIATVPRRGYRFTGIVREVVQRLPGTGDGIPQDATESTGPRVLGPLDAANQFRRNSHNGVSPHAAISEAEANTATYSKSTYRFRAAGLIAAAIVIGTLAGVLTYAALSPPSVPRMIRTKQMTHSGRVDPWARMISDGARIYFLEREGDHWNLAQTSVNGGETQIIAAPFRNTVLLDISPDHSQFLAASFVYRDANMPLWIWPVQGGPPTRIGDLTAYDAAWHPNGRQIVYSKEDGVYLVDVDGAHPRPFAPTRGQPRRFAWSPDGKRLRFSVFPDDVPGSSLWEIAADGSHLHQLIPDWNQPPAECCGAWSPDGRYFFFGSFHGGSNGLWILQEKRSSLRRRQLEPYGLTAGEPTFLAPPLVAADGHRLYAFASSLKAELVSYDIKSGQFTTILPGMGADYAKYSRDGQWIAYIAIPDGALWRVSRKGSARNRVTPSSIHADSPTWSPDGTKIAFLNRKSPNCASELYLSSAEGGSPRQLFPNECEQIDPAWSPDGELLTFVRKKILPSGSSDPTIIEMLDLATNRLSTLVGSQGLRGPSWSPDGKLIAATTDDLHRVMLFDVRTQKWTNLSQGTLLNAGVLKWSRDGHYLYFQDLLAPNEPIYRVRISDHRREEMVSFGNFIRAGVPRCAFVDLAPDGSPIATLLRNHADIYALDLSAR